MKVAIIHKETLNVCAIYEKNDDIEICLKRDFSEENHLFIDVSDETTVKNIKIGSDGTATIDPFYMYEEIRQKRNGLLIECDWTQMNDTPLDINTKQKWVVYRQALRDLPNTITDPVNPTWPTPPS